MQKSDAWEDLGGQPAGLETVLAQAGRMGREILAHDWSTTPLGPMDDWTLSLRTTVCNLIASGQPIGFWAGPALTTFFNDAFIPILGERAATALGKPLSEVWFDVWDDILPMVRTALSGETVWRENLPLSMRRNGFDEATFWTFSYSPVRDEAGRVFGFLDIVTETTAAVVARGALERANDALAAEVLKSQQALEDRREAEQRQRLLQRELTHRMKNTLAMVQAIVSQSLRHATSIEDAGNVAAARIQALGRAQDMLNETGWEASPIEDVVAAAIAPHHDGAGASTGRFSLGGSPGQLTPQQGMGLSLAVHELATNAAKYGALSTAEGRIAITWTIGADESFHFEWREEGGPAVVPPVRKGFGSRLTERIVPTYFSGKAQLDYRPAGVIFLLDGTLAIGR